MIRDLLEIIWRFITHRLFLLFVISCVFLYILLARLFELQIVEGKNLEKEFSIGILRELPLEGVRGSIYDRYGTPLAYNEIAYTVTLDASVEVEDKSKMILELVNIIEKNGDEIALSFPIELDEEGNLVYNVSNNSVKRFKRNIFSHNLTLEQEAMPANEVFDYLIDKRFFDISLEEYTVEETLKILNIRYALHLTRYSKFKPETIAVNISDETLAEIKENQNVFPGVKTPVTPLRVYDDAIYFSHIIGYTGNITEQQLETLEPHGYDANDIVGKVGIEKEMELYLRGTDGTQFVEVDNLGRTRNVLETISPGAGKDVFLTIDAKLQKEAYQALEKQIARVVADNMEYITPPKATEKVILLKDVFAAMFERGIISLDELEESTPEQHQNVIYRTFSRNYDLVLDDIEYLLLTDDSMFSKELYPYLRIITNHLFGDDILLSTYKKSDVYTQYKTEEIGFRAFLLGLIADNQINTDVMMTKFNDYDEDNLYTYLKEYILDFIVLREEFIIEVYMQQIYNINDRDWTYKDYKDLCFLVIEQNIVTATDEVKNNLFTGIIKPIDFIKEKIIDLEITPQQLALDPSSGSAVVVDVSSGEVLSLVSYPSYDNNYFANGIDGNYYLQLIDDPTNPMYQRATKERRPPGSSFKMLSAMAGLEEGVIDANTIIRDEGVYDKISPVAKCWIWNLGKRTHGDEDVIDALRDSCNYFFYEVGYQLSIDDNNKRVDTIGINNLNKYASMFGLDSLSGIELPEEDPRLPERDASRNSIGQGQNSYTPVQLARYVATLANGGILYELNIIDKLVNPAGELFDDKTPYIERVNDFNPENVKLVHEGMYAVTHEGGTASSIFRGFPIEVAGKTGTAQEMANRPEHAVFTAFAPYDEPEIAVVVVIPFGYTAQNSGKVVKEIIGSYYDINAETESTSYNHTLDN